MQEDTGKFDRKSYEVWFGDELIVFIGYEKSFFGYPAQHEIFLDLELSLLYFGNGLLDVDFLSRLIDFFILFFGCSIRSRLLSFVRELNRVSLTWEGSNSTNYYFCQGLESFY